MGWPIIGGLAVCARALVVMNAATTIASTDALVADLTLTMPRSCPVDYSSELPSDWLLPIEEQYQAKHVEAFLSNTFPPHA
jgi:hypothetical protein